MTQFSRFGGGGWESSREGLPPLTARRVTRIQDKQKCLKVSFVVMTDGLLSEKKRSQLSVPVILSHLVGPQQPVTVPLRVPCKVFDIRSACNKTD